MKTCAACNFKGSEDKIKVYYLSDIDNNYRYFCSICYDNSIYKILFSDLVDNSIKITIKMLCQIGNTLENNQDMIEDKIDKIINKICPDMLD